MHTVRDKISDIQKFFFTLGLMMLDLTLDTINLITYHLTKPLCLVIESLV